jgi:transmembrane sensor
MLPRASISSQEASAWQQRRLVFRKHTLAEIAAEFNRYNRSPQIRVEGDALRERRFSGVFDADDPETLLQYLKADSRFTFDRTGDELIIRMRSSLAQTAPAD